MRGLVVGLAFVLSVGCGSGGQATSTTVSTFEITGVIRVPFASFVVPSVRFTADVKEGNGCEPVNEYADLERSSVAVRDGNGRTIGSTALAPGRVVLSERPGVCELGFSTRVPRAAFYEVTVDGRPPVTTSFEDIQSAGWRIVVP